MSVRRKGTWLAFGLVFLFYGISTFNGRISLGSGDSVTENSLWDLAAQMAFSINLFMPVIAGISAADRLVRDHQLGVDELLHSTSLPRGVHLAGKYCGVLLSLLIPVFSLAMLLSLVEVAYGKSFIFLGMSLVTFLTMSLPAVAFVTAFSLAVPTVLPLRVYQVLFTGYWFWGNYLNPAVFPTIAGSLLTANGRIAMEGWFGRFLGTDRPLAYSSTDVFINLGLLALLAAAALVVAGRVLAWRDRRA
jgi:ABC-type transport system involved in multi-copper enzyme maturation permease subunit